MRRVLLVIAAAVGLAGCGRGQASRVAWPQPSTTAEDGGESLAPREPGKMPVVADKADEASEAKPTVAPTTTPDANVDAPAASAPAVTPPMQQDILINEDIIIDIDD